MQFSASYRKSSEAEKPSVEMISLALSPVKPSNGNEKEEEETKVEEEESSTKEIQRVTVVGNG